MDGNFGHVLCFGYKWLDEKKTNIISITDFPRFKKDRTDDRHVICKARDILLDAPVWVTWYGRKFDVPFLNTRLMLYGENPISYREATQHIDLWFTARYALRFSSNRLASVAEFMDIPHKIGVSSRLWERARSGYSDGINKIISHCKRDVEMTEEAYKRMRPHVARHPNMALIKEEPLSCPRCGTGGTCKFKSYRYTLSHKYAQYRCKACLGWSRGPNETIFKPLMRAV